VAGVLPASDFLHGDGNVEADLRSCGSVPCDREGLFRGALFFIRRRRVTRLTLREYVTAWLEAHLVKDAIDHISSDLSEEFYIPLSTAYWWLRLVREWCLGHFVLLGLDPNRLSCLLELRWVEKARVLKVFELEFSQNKKPP
jgi:hypothetical protein